MTSRRSNRPGGGYYENLEPDWTPSAPGFHAGDRKSLDIHMHLLEAFTALYDASRAEVHRRRLEGVIDVILSRLVDPVCGCGCGRNPFDLASRRVAPIAIRRTWNAEREGELAVDVPDTTSYGHNLELVRNPCHHEQAHRHRVQPCALGHRMVHAVPLLPLLAA